MRGGDSIPMLTLDGLREELRGAASVLITTHLNPDGDALGSAGALALFLRARGTQARVLVDWPIPENLHFLRDGAGIEEYDPAQHDALFGSADLLVAVDMNAPSRMGRIADVAASAGIRILVIDHHLDPRPFADGYCLRSDACATAEILFDLIEAEEGLTPAIAEALYTGILTDTGSFRFERTTSRVFRIAAELLDAGVQPQDVYRRIYDEYPMRRTRLVGRVLAGIRSLADGRATLLAVTKEDLDATDGLIEDVENIVNYGLSIRGVLATALVTEMPGGVKVSFRSRGDVSIQPLAQRFGGGGHRYAAGATLDGADVAEIIDRVRRGLQELFDGQ